MKYIFLYSFLISLIAFSINPSNTNSPAEIIHNRLELASEKISLLQKSIEYKKEQLEKEIIDIINKNNNLSKTNEDLTLTINDLQIKISTLEQQTNLDTLIVEQQKKVEDLKATVQIMEKSPTLESLEEIRKKKKYIDIMVVSLENFEEYVKNLLLEPVILSGIIEKLEDIKQKRIELKEQIIKMEQEIIILEEEVKEHDRFFRTLQETYAFLKIQKDEFTKNKTQITEYKKFLQSEEKKIEESQKKLQRYFKEYSTNISKTREQINKYKTEIQKIEADILKKEQEYAKISATYNNQQYKLYELEILYYYAKTQANQMNMDLNITKAKIEWFINNMEHILTFEETHLDQFMKLIT